MPALSSSWGKSRGGNYRSAVALHTPALPSRPVPSPAHAVRHAPRRQARGSPTLEAKPEM